MITNAHSVQMKECLEQTLVATEMFIDSLTAEHDAISQQDINAFESAVSQKLAALEKLSRRDLERVTLVKAIGLKPGPEGMVHYLQQCQAGSRTPDLWKKLLSRAVVSRELNRRNHLLVENFSRYTHKALCILRGENPEQNVYGPGGNAADHHGSRSLAKA